MFATVQGEGSKTGTPSTFVRLQGCGVGCPWCDTKHTWLVNGNASTLHDILTKDGSDARFAWIDVGHLIAHVTQLRPTTHVVITGGEPCQYDLVELTDRLIKTGHSVQIETSGTEPVRAVDATFVTMSPKFNMPGGRSVVQQAIERANEFKMPVGKPADVAILQAMLKRRRRPWTPGDIWLQPISESEKATELCRQAAAEHGWRVSLQMHKQAHIR